MHQQQTAFQNIAGKGEIALKEQFLLYLQCLLLNQIIVCPLVHIFDTISVFSAEFEKPKISISGKGLKSRFTARTIFPSLSKSMQQHAGCFFADIAIEMAYLLSF